MVRWPCQQSARTRSSHNGPIVPSSQAVWRRFLGHPYPPKPGPRLTPWRTEARWWPTGSDSALLPCSGSPGLRSHFLPTCTQATGHLLRLASPVAWGVAPRPSPTPTLVQVPGGRKCQWGGGWRPDIFGLVGLIPATTACPTGSRTPFLPVKPELGWA